MRYKLPYWVPGKGPLSGKRLIVEVVADTLVKAVEALHAKGFPIVTLLLQGQDLRGLCKMELTFRKFSLWCGCDLSGVDTSGWKYEKSNLVGCYSNDLAATYGLSYSGERKETPKKPAKKTTQQRLVEVLLHSKRSVWKERFDPMLGRLLETTNTHTGDTYSIRLFTDTDRRVNGKDVIGSLSVIRVDRVGNKESTTITAFSPRELHIHGDEIRFGSLLLSATTGLHQFVVREFNPHIRYRG